MTFTVTANLIGAILGALVLLVMTYGMFLSMAFATTRGVRWVSFALAVVFAVGAVLLVMAGGGWL